MKKITISIEGADGLGKFTQSQMLSVSLASSNKNVQRYATPWSGEAIFYPLIQSMLSSGYVKKFPTIFQILHFFNKLVLLIFEWEISSDVHYVIYDRWSMSSSVYGEAMGVPTWLTRFTRWILPKPDIEFILVGHNKRSSKRDRLEENVKLQETVNALYKQKIDDNCFIIDADKSVEAIHQDILSIVNEYTRRKNENI